MMFNGLFDLPWWGVIAVAFVLTHITAIGISLYLHRHSAHRALDLHPIVSHFLRFWLWMTTGMETKAWTAIHRKHHAKCETEEDPHSPQILGIKKVLLEGSELYRKEAKNKETLERYGQGTPDDWIERNVYRHSTVGIGLMFLIDVILFGPIGITLWALQMVWSPLFAAGIINGIGHYIGYRNFECNDAATNVVPWGILIMGEELHNNHHTFATSAKFSVKPWEFDIGWMYIQILSFFGLARAKRIPPELHINPSKNQIDLETVKVLVRNRFEVMSAYSKQVLRPVVTDMKATVSKKMKRKLYKALIKNSRLLKHVDRAQIATAVAAHPQVKVVYQFQQKLQAIWDKTAASHKELVEALQDWCKQAEQTRIKALQEFAASIRTYALPSTA